MVPTEPSAPPVAGRAGTPVAGAIAGILFAALFSLGIGVLLSATPPLQEDVGQWLDSGLGDVRFAVGLLPFAGIFFLWFLAVARERLGEFEDQFFSTVFMGSGLIFLALVFVAAASLGTLIVISERASAQFAGGDAYLYGRTLVGVIFNVYALRMASVFMFSQATLWLRTGVMPNWLAYITYLLATVLLLVVTQSLWVVLVFPAWVSLVSVYILLHTFVVRRS